jgi:hypothetical protein
VLKDLSIWTMEKVKRTKKGSRNGDLHLGSCARMDADTALQKANAMKAEVLGFKH